MNSRFVLSQPASRDLGDIFGYILENDGPQRALHVLEGLESAFDKLAESPELGHRRDDLTALPVLFYAVWSFLII
jgi:plasmid stabilization system protein ParE